MNKLKRLDDSAFTRTGFSATSFVGSRVASMMILGILREKRGHRTEIGKWSQGNVWLVDIFDVDQYSSYKTMSYAINRAAMMRDFYNDFFSLLENSHL
jgi:hypothetical protein